jgi:hypothetical protein
MTKTLTSIRKPFLMMPKRRNTIQKSRNPKTTVVANRVHKVVGSDGILNRMVIVVTALTYSVADDEKAELGPESPTPSNAATLSVEEVSSPSSRTDSTRTLPLQWDNSENVQLGSPSPSIASTLSYHLSDHENDEKSIQIESAVMHILPIPRILKRKV